jgi:hypothetical protein
MEKEANGRRTAPSIRDRKNPPKDLLCHQKGLWVGNKEKYESGIESVFGFQGKIYRRRLICHFSVLAREKCNDK